MRFIGMMVIAALQSLAAPVSARETGPRVALSSAVAPSARAAAAAVDAFHAALRRGDTRAASALLASDALIFESGAVERSKTEYTTHHLPADVEFERSVSSIATRRAGRSSGDFAWIASEGRTTGTYKGRALDRITTETMLLRRTGGAWKIVHIHWSSAAKP